MTPTGTTAKVYAKVHLSKLVEISTMGFAVNVTMESCTRLANHPDKEITIE